MQEINIAAGVIVVVTFFGGLWYAIACAGAKQVRRLTKAEVSRLDPLAAEEWLLNSLQLELLDPDWLTKNQFAFDGVYQIGDSTHYVAWRRQVEQTYLCVLYVSMDPVHRVELDIHSSFANGSLTTSTSSDGGATPRRPGELLQSFSAHNAAELWKHHQTGLDYLKRGTGLSPLTKATNLCDDLRHSIRADAEYVTSIPYWKLRMPYWHFFKRGRWHGVSIQEQFERGKIPVAEALR